MTHPDTTTGDDDTACGCAAEPIDLLGTLTPEPILRSDMLPDTIADFALDAAERIGVELAMVAMPALAVCAGALDDRVQIQPRARDTQWTESARLWVAVVAESGAGKTPAANAAKKPLRVIEDKWDRDYRREVAIYLAAKAAHALNPAVVVPDKPVLRRASVTDATTEALADVLADNPRGLFGDFDELTFLIGGFDAYRGASTRDRPIWLELWNGGKRRIDRKNKEPVVPNWSASIYGGIQTTRLASMARNLVDDGLLQRFLLFMSKSNGTGVDRAHDRAATRRYYGTVQMLASVNPEHPCPPVRLSDNARPYWDEVVTLAHKLQHEAALPSALRNWLAKVPGNFARLLLTYHAIECATATRGIDDMARLWRGELDPRVSGDTAHRARDLMVRFLIPSAMRVDHAMFPRGEGSGEHARWIAGYILSKGLGEVRDRDIYNNYRALEDPMRDRKARGAAMDILVACNWVAPADSEPVTKWTVNPLVHERFAQHAQDEARRRQRAREDIAEAARVRRETWPEAAD